MAAPGQDPQDERATSPPPDTGDSLHETDESARRLPPLPFFARIGVLLVGWILLLIGIAGLALPGIQGCLTIALGAALLSLASEMIYRWLKKGLRRWPKVWARVERMRAWTHAKLTGSRPGVPPGPAAANAAPEDAGEEE